MASSLLLRRRATSTSTAWTPKKLSGVVAWWSAVDPAGANGASVAAWTDRINNLTASQGTGANQPTIKTGGVNGQQAIHGAGSQTLVTSGIGSIPNGTTGPFTVVVVQMPTATGAGGTYSEYIGVSSASNNGYVVGRNGPVMDFTQRAVTEYVPTLSITSTNNNPDVLVYTYRADKTVEFGKLHYPDPYTTKSGTTAANAGAAAVTLFGDPSGDTFTGDIYDIIVTTTALTGADRQALADWVFTRYSIPTTSGYNAPANVTVTTADGSGTVVEPSICYFPSGWNGKNYWMAFVPLGSGADSNENPEIQVSTDGNTWAAPAGLTNPVVALPAAGTNSDPGLFYNPNDNKLYLYWQVSGDPTTANNGVFVKSSSDGVTWSSATQVLVSGTNSANNVAFNEPNVAWDGSQYVMWYFDLTASITSPVIYRRTSASPTSGWSAPTACSLTIPGTSIGARKPWHWGAMQRIGGKWVTAVSDQEDRVAVGAPGSYKAAWMISSTDGLNFTCASRAIMVGGIGKFDEIGIYRMTLVDAGDGTNLYAWYTGRNIGDMAHWKLSQRVTIPRTVIP